MDSCSGLRQPFVLETFLCEKVLAKLLALSTDRSANEAVTD